MIFVSRFTKGDADHALLFPDGSLLAGVQKNSQRRVDRREGLWLAVSPVPPCGDSLFERLDTRGVGVKLEDHRGIIGKWKLVIGH